MAEIRLHHFNLLDDLLSKYEDQSFYAELGKAIQEGMVRKRISLQELVNLTTFNAKYVRDVVDGRQDNISLWRVRRILYFLDMDLSIVQKKKEE